MIGGIIERASTIPKILICSPLPQSLWKQSNFIASTTVSTECSKDFDKINLVNDIIRNPGNLSANVPQNNDILIENLDASELQSAIEEINSLISARNIQYLCKSSQQTPNRMPHKSESTNNVGLMSSPAKLLSGPLESVTPFPFERYDLQGRRVIMKSTISQYFLDAFQSVDRFLHVSSFNRNYVSCQFCSLLSALDLFFIFDDSESAQLVNTEPQNELFNHEQSPESPGYTLNEVCELCRSEYPNQRIIGFRILSGVLKRRDFVVSLNSYRDENVLVNLNEFLDYVEAFNKLIDICSSWESFSCDRNSLGDILVELMLRFCASNSLPTSIPSLLLREIKAHNSAPALRLATLHCLNAYLNSSVEKSFSDALWLGFWGAFGAPPLLTPHAKRSDHVSYEHHFMNCIEKAKSLVTNTEQETDVAPTQEECNDKFVLACRWSRIDSMVVESNIIKSLVDAAFDSVKFIVQCEGGVSNNPLVSIGLISVMILNNLVMSAGSVVTLRAVHDQLFAVRVGTISLITTLVEVLVKRKSRSHSDARSTVILTEWFRLLTEISRRCGLSAEILFIRQQADVLRLITVSFQSFIISVNVEVETNTVAVWAMRLWRVALIYGVGLDLVADLLEPIFSSHVIDLDGLISQLIGTEFTFEFASDISLLLVTELFWLFEQGVVATSFAFSSGSHVAETERCGFALMQASVMVAKKLVDILSFGEIFTFSLMHTAQIHFLASSVGVQADCVMTSESRVVEGTRLANSILSHTLVRGIGLLQHIRLGCVCSPRLKDQCDALQAEMSRDKMICMDVVLKSIRSIYERRGSVGHSKSARWMSSERLAALSRILLFFCSVTQLGDSVSESLTALEPEITPCSVSSGILSWQSSRLDQTIILIRLQLLALTNDSVLLQETVRSMGQLSDSLSGCAVFLFNRILEEILITSRRQHPGATNNLASTRKALLQAVLGVEASEEMTAVRWGVAPLDGLFGRGVSLFITEAVESVAATNWVFDCFTGRLPLNGSWQYACLKHLSGDNLLEWLRALLLFEKSNENVSSAPGSGNELSTKIYFLLRLLTKDGSTNWHLNAIDDEVDPDLVGAYCGLLSLLTESASRSTEFGESLRIVAQSNHFSVSSVLSHRGSGNVSHSSGLLELCDELLESAFSCCVDFNAHAAALRVLISPSIVWVVRERVWKSLGELRLLHLMEGPEFASEISHNECLLVGSNRTEYNVCLAILHSLNTLRSVDDRNWRVVGVGLFQIARFIFCSLNIGDKLHCTQLNVLSEKLLVHVLVSTEFGSDEDKISDWLVAALLTTANQLYFIDLCSSRLSCLENFERSYSLRLLPVETQCHYWSKSLNDVKISSNCHFGLSIKSVLIQCRPGLVTTK